MRNLLIVLLCFVSIQVSAQSLPQVRAFEGEFSYGMAIPTNDLGGDVKVGKNRLLQLEVRYNLPWHPIDVGVLLRGTTIHRLYEPVDDVWPTDADWDVSAWYTMAVADYNFRRGSDASFFVGLGAGIGSQDAWNDDDVDVKFCMMPRVGVELWKHLRLTLAYTYMDKQTNNFGLSIGVVFGGGNKK